MKFFIAFAALVAVAVAGTIPVKPISSETAEIEAIIAAIQSPSTDPATAILLEQQLEAILANTPLVPEPISVGPAIISPEPVSVGPAIIAPEPVAIGPEIIDFPLPDGGAVTAPITPSPVIVGPIQAGQPAPLVQIILNINQADSMVPPVSVIAPEPIAPTPVIVVDQAVEPVQVVDTPTVVEPVQVVDTPTVIEPVQVVDVAPIVPEAVIIGTPIIPAPAVVLPEILN